MAETVTSVFGGHMIEWRDKDLRERFSAALVELVRASHPGVLDGTSS
jgi:hypothetical protein